MSNISRTRPCPEPGCGGSLILKSSRCGPFYGCARYATTRCPGSHGAHPDGTPLGIPADPRTKRARMVTHASFDRLWKHGGMTRTEAYRGLQAAMRLSKEEAHIGRFTAEQCPTLIQAVQAWPHTHSSQNAPRPVTASALPESSQNINR